MAQKLIQERVGGPPPPNASYNQRMPPNSPGQQGLLGHGPPRPMTQPGFQGPPPQFNNAPPNLAPPVMPTPPMQSPPGYPSGAPPVVPHNSGQYHNYQQQPPQQPPQPAMPQAPPPAPTTPAAPTNNPDHSAAWAAYYQSMYQQQQQTRPAAPATNTNQGAQPDYTKAWEEYFKVFLYSYAINMIYRLTLLHSSNSKQLVRQRHRRRHSPHNLQHKRRRIIPMVKLKITQELFTRTIKDLK